MRRKYGSGEIVPAGYYLRNDTWEIVRLSEDGALPEGEAVAYYRVPLPLVLLGAPMAGLGWFLVFPFIIPLVVGYVVFWKVLAPVVGTFKRVSHRFAANPDHHQAWHG